MSTCRTARIQATTDECGNAVTPDPLPLTTNEQVRSQSPLNRAFTDKFLMVFDVPQCIKAQTQKSFRECNQISLDQMQFNIFGTVVPTIAMGTVGLPYHGHTVKVASHNRTMEPMAVQYFIDNTFSNYWVLWAWAEFIIGSRTSTAGGEPGSTLEQANRKYDNVLPKDYSTNISIIGLDAYNQPRVEWVYTGCVLSSVGGIQWNYQSSNEAISSFSFEYSFLDCILR